MAKDWTNHLKDKMDNYTEMPGEEVWKGIAVRTGIAGRRRIPVWIPSMAAAAAVVAGVFIAMKNVDRREDIDIVAVAENPVNEGNTLAFNDVESVNVAEETMALENPKAHGTMKAAALDREVVIGKASAAGKEIGAEKVDAAEKVAGITETGEGTGTMEEEVPQNTTETYEDGNLQSAVWTDWEEPKTARRKKGFSVGVGASGSGRTAGSLNRPTALAMGANPLLSNDYYTALTSSALRDKVGSLTFDQPEVQTEYTHRIPVKVGLAARYNIGRFGFETGLDYSILTSDLKTGEEGKTWSKGTQTLHYIGIPVNASFNFLDKRYVTLYISAGGEMEKCVRGRTKTDEYEDGKYLRTTDNSLKVKPLQWSVNAAAGVQVNILRSLGAYVEPGVIHHFDNGAKVRSSYTDKPTDFSLRFGLRYSFGL
ncbi:MAG: porin family protein [Candidatus Cryptobacteroides sp.]